MRDDGAIKCNAMASPDNQAAAACLTDQAVFENYLGAVLNDDCVAPCLLECETLENNIMHAVERNQRG